MVRYETGMLAWSLAGHDKHRLYVVTGVEEEYVYLCDGRLKPLERPKKKNIRHIQIRHEIPEELQGKTTETMKNEEIRRVIRRFSNV
mgnify:FL=1